MKATKYLIFAILVVAVPFLGGCDSSDQLEYSKNYDIPWIISSITSVSPLEGAPGTSVTIGGENLGADFVPATGITFGTEICTIISQTATSVTVTVANLGSSEAVEISVTNLHNRKFVFESKFTPVLE